MFLLAAASVMHYAEDKIYMQSKGKYRCNFKKISDYKIDGVPLSDVYSQFVIQYANNETLNMLLSEKAAKNPIYISFVNLFKEGYKHYLGPEALSKIKEYNQGVGYALNIDNLIPYGYYRVVSDNNDFHSDYVTIDSKVLTKQLVGILVGRI